MANLVDLETLVGFGAEADAALAKVVRAVMQLGNWSVTGWADFRPSATGLHLHVPFPVAGKIAKTTGTAIPAMSGSTPGVGDITLYSLGGSGTPLQVGEPDIAYNIAPEEVTADTWIVVMKIDTEYVVVLEICPVV